MNYLNNYQNESVTLPVDVVSIFLILRFIVRIYMFLAIDLLILNTHYCTPLISTRNLKLNEIVQIIINFCLKLF